MANRISTVLDIDDKGFKNSLKSIGSAVGEADGLFGKFKAGTTAGLDAVKANAGAFALAGGAALVAFGTKAVGAFTDASKAAIDLGKATGLSTEEASRWIGVGDDFEVGADQLTASLGRVAKTLDSVKWSNYGIATRDAGGKARDTNDILLDTFDMLGKITNETERARVGNDLFGKGYANIAPLIGKTRGEYEKMLGAVEKGQVITDQEAEKAEAFRLAQDQLSDALHEVTLEVGQQVAGLAPLLSGLADLIALQQKLGSGLGSNNPFTALSDGIDGIKRSWHAFQGDNVKAQEALDKAAEAARGYSYAAYDVARSQTEAENSVRSSTNAIDGYSYAATDAASTIKGLQDRNKMMTDDLKRGLDADKAAMDNLLGVINDDESWLNLQNEIAATTALFDENGNVIVEKGKDSAQAMRDAALAVDGLKKDVIAYGVEVLGLPTSKITEIVAAVDPQNLADIEALLAALTRNRNVSLSIIAKGGAGYNDNGTPSFDAGGVVPGPMGAPVAATVHGGEMVLTPAQQASVGGDGSTYNITVNGANMTPDQLVAAIKTYERRNGPGWRN